MLLLNCLGRAVGGPQGVSGNGGVSLMDRWLAAVPGAQVVSRSVLLELATGTDFARDLFDSMEEGEDTSDLHFFVYG